MDTCFADGFLMPMLARVANLHTANLPPTDPSLKVYAFDKQVERQQALQQ
jgi:hypothetical protein